MASSGTLVHAIGHNWLGKADIAVQTIFLTLGLVAVGLRLWSRRLQLRSLQINDWFIVLATVS
jgi:phosphatidylglycerophosphate synthase